MARPIFQANVGTVDRAVRVLVGVVLLLLVAFQVIGLWGLVGIVPLATGLLGYCPLYRVLGINTCGMRKAT
ncbi:DUF2892 domain-containing protein [Ramlibacter sp. USB13]|uniref:DUF2892 domain-containing protein n=1 Tax=Ramlibacter cellulosilyticus TaxID=2764187 RepID=A0A923SGF9_9BURK|nr:DUF2892 domain-containing protein [Ramlibacter cellulosilyticus]MBC5784902.1 DUF2892 domain-containing protein [Ramlibacter cellulosilyticus]